jgi:hypothetical protein
MAKKSKESSKTGKRVRVSLGSHRYKLQLSDEDLKGFKKRHMVPRWVNDQDGRIAQAQAGGYKFVDPKHVSSLGEGAIHQGNTDEGARVSKIVSRGEPAVRAYLMEIWEQHYKEDQDAKEANLKKIDDALSVGQAGGADVENQYGEGVTYSH